MTEKSAEQQIDEIIGALDGWKGEILSNLRKVILKSEPQIIEEIKWRMATRPEGLPVWTRDGIVCFAEIWKDNVKLLFFKGAQIADPKKLFNARLNSSSIRAIEFHEGDSVDEDGLIKLVAKAVEINEKNR